MEIKKTPKADLENKKSTWMLIGYVIVLAFMFIAFEWTKRDIKIDTSQALTDLYFEEEMVPITEQEEKVAPPPPEVAPINETLEIVADDADVEETVIASSEDRNFTYYPKGFQIPADVDYLHITSNNTIRGTEIFEDLDSPVPLIADMSSDICSRPIDVKKYMMIYGGCQKNLGPAGATFVIIRNDYLDKVVADRKIPTMLKYQTHVDNGSMFNTPPCINIFAVGQTLKWIKQMGGVEAMERRAIERCNALYSEFDRNTVFRAVVEEGSRSRMNIPFLLAEGYEELEKEFLDFCKSKNIVGVKGHRLVGGFRASTYNACTMEDVNALIAAMQEFEKAHKK